MQYHRSKTYELLTTRPESKRCRWLGSLLLLTGSRVSRRVGNRGRSNQVRWRVYYELRHTIYLAWCAVSCSDRTHQSG